MRTKTMTTITAKRRATGTGILLAAAVAVFALVGAGSAAAAPTRATDTCWKDVVNDWLQHQPNVVGNYPIACYTQAIQHLDAYPDIEQYSNAPDDIHRALLAAIQNNHGDGPGSSGSFLGPPPPSGGSSSGGSSSGGSGGGGGGTSASGGGQSQPSKSAVTKLFNAVGPGDAQTIPLPLLVLAGLAILLLLSAAGVWIAKRLQARRMTPVPAPASSTRQ